MSIKPILEHTSLTPSYSMDCFTWMSDLILEQEFNFPILYTWMSVVTPEQKFYFFYSIEEIRV